MKAPAPWLLLALLASACLSLATYLQPEAAKLTSSEQSDSVMKLLLGDSRRVFANQLFIEADVAFHSGYYPSVWDQAQAPKDSRHMTASEGSAEEEEHERQMNFLGTPADWLEGFGRHFMITEHTHLQGGNEREILPWLKLSAELDPHRVDSYTVASYWLRNALHQPEDAEKFLREGLRNNPDSYELLLELGRLYHENLHEDQRARGVWELALKRWQQKEGSKKSPDNRAKEEIAINLARLEEQAGDLTQAIAHLEMAAAVSPQPQTLRQQISELKTKAASTERSSR